MSNAHVPYSQQGVNWAKYIYCFMSFWYLYYGKIRKSNTLSCYVSCFSLTVDVLSCMFCSLGLWTYLIFPEICGKIRLVSVSHSLSLQSHFAFASAEFQAYHWTGAPFYVLYEEFQTHVCHMDVESQFSGLQLKILKGNFKIKTINSYTFFPRFLSLESRFNFLRFWYGFKAVLIFGSLRHSGYLFFKTSKPGIQTCLNWYQLVRQ